MQSRIHVDHKLEQPFSDDCSSWDHGWVCSRLHQFSSISKVPLHAVWLREKIGQILSNKKQRAFVLWLSISWSVQREKDCLCLPDDIHSWGVLLTGGSKFLSFLDKNPRRWNCQLLGVESGKYRGVSAITFQLDNGCLWSISGTRGWWQWSKCKWLHYDIVSFRWSKAEKI